MWCAALARRGRDVGDKERPMTTHPITTHKGGCHCGNIAYEFDAEIGTVLDCNCSLCQKRGGLLQFIPASAFRLLTSPDDLGTYKFNKQAIAHHFCKVCGIDPFSEGSDAKGNKMVAINMRCVEGVDPRALDIRPFNGRDR